MKNFKTKTLVAAFAGLSAAGAVGVAEAVYLNPDGLGQVLIYPYYTVRTKAAVAPFDTYLSVVNTTNSAKAVKVRFLEGKNSKERKIKKEKELGRERSWRKGREKRKRELKKKKKN